MSDSDSESEGGDTPISSLKTISTDGYHFIFTPKSASSKPSKKKQKKTPGFQSSLVLTSRNSSKAELEPNLSITHFLAANSLPLYLAECSLLPHIITHAGSVGSSYKMPSRQDVGGKYLDATYNSYREEAKRKLLSDAATFGIMMLGDGATIKDIPQVNVIAASENNPSCCLDVIDCSNHMSIGGKKDAWYICKLFLPILNEIDPKKELIDLVAFDGTLNIQKAAKLMAEHFPRVSVIAGLEHTVSLIFGRFMNTEVLSVICNFCNKESCLCCLLLLGTSNTYCFSNSQVRHVFGGAHHAPHALFVSVSKMHDNGHVLLFLRPSECRMGGFALQLMRVMRLKNVLKECTASKCSLVRRSSMSEGRILLIALEYYLRKFHSITRDFARGKLQGPARAILRYAVRPLESLLHYWSEYSYSI
jgi:hypothetical protein